MSPGQELVREAERWLGTRELPGNRGVFVDFANLFAIGDWKWAKGQPWCASFVYLMGRLSLGHDWPLPKTASVQALADAGVRVMNDTPLHIGCLILVWYSSKQRYGHVGIVTKVEGDRIHTIEGNSNTAGSRDGFAVVLRSRVLGPKLFFLNWEQLL